MNRTRVIWKYETGLLFVLCSAAILMVSMTAAWGQEGPLGEFDYDSDGPWNDEALANIVVTKVANSAVQLDGIIGASEYSYQSHEIIPTVSGWPIAWPGEQRHWADMADSSFTFYLAHDDEYLYVAVDVNDDMVRQDAASPAQYWQDDAIELFLVGDLLTPPNIYGYDQRYGTGEDYPYGGHFYFTYNEKMRGIDDAGNDTLNQIFQASEWTFGPDGDISSKGAQSGSGWVLEVRIAKRLFEARDVPYLWLDSEGQAYDIDLSKDPVAFSIGMDDDDGSFTERGGFELQYWAQMRSRLDGFTRDEAMTWTAEEIANNAHVDWYGFQPRGDQLNTGTFGTLLLSEEMVRVEGWAIY